MDYQPRHYRPSSAVPTEPLLLKDLATRWAVIPPTPKPRRWPILTAIAVAIVGGFMTGHTLPITLLTADAPPAPTWTAPTDSVPLDRINLVGLDIRPGVYHAPGGKRCTWTRRSAVTGGASSTLARSHGTGPQTVTIAPTDVAFDTAGCGAWTK